MGEIVGRIELTIGWPICHDMPIHIDTWEYNPTQKWWAPQSTVGAPVGLDNFFPVGAVPKLKMPSQEKNHSTIDVARLGFRKTNVGARKIGLVT